jgi:hypothetical protein
VRKVTPPKKTPTPKKQKQKRLPNEGVTDENDKEREEKGVSRLATSPASSAPPATPTHLSSSLETLGEPLGSFYAFPTTTQLLGATEERLRLLGFGYRAKFIAGAAAALAAKEDGADAYLLSLREKTPYREAQAALTSLPGVGPKVAACACLFSLDKHAAVPVDTHVWQLAVEHYTPELEGKSLTPKLMEKVEDAIVNVFGEYAGWAHNTLFVAELAHVRASLPEELRTPPRAKVVKKEKREVGSGAKAESKPESNAESSPVAKKRKE